MTIAKITRILSIPSIFISVLLLMLFFISHSFSVATLIFSLIFLGALPVIGYPLQKVIPSLKKGGRPLQRKLAFISTGVGYILGFVYSLICNIGTEAKTLFLGYTITLVILIICNVLKIKASGHAAGIAGPLIYCLYFYGLKSLIPLIIIYALVLWSSVKLKRHTYLEFILGTVAAAIGAVLSIVIYSFI